VLSLERNLFGDIAAREIGAALKAGGLPALRILHLSNNIVTNEGAKVLREAAVSAGWEPHTHEMDLRFNRITDGTLVWFGMGP
jgi:hypothetical protein